MVEIMRVLGELIFWGRVCEYMIVNGNSYEFLSTISMHILKCDMAWLILPGKYCCNIKKTRAPIAFFMWLSNVPIIKCNCESYVLLVISSLSSRHWVIWYFWKGKIIILQKNHGHNQIILQYLVMKKSRKKQYWLFISWAYFSPLDTNFQSSQWMNNITLLCLDLHLLTSKLQVKQKDYKLFNYSCMLLLKVSWVNAMRKIGQIL